MSWDYFALFAIVALLFWGLGAFAAWRGKRPVVVYTLTCLGLAVFFSFIVGMWISLERPPMRTMGETRLWYSFFLPLAGIITYSRWRYKWILGFSSVLSLVFVCINIFRPEIHNKTLMPALQSPWFTPHVIVYMFAYAMLGAATVMAVYLLWFKKKGIERHEMALCDNLTYVGLAFMTLGMLSGAVWAKAAWGHYWAWIPRRLGRRLPGSPIWHISISDWDAPRPIVRHCLACLYLFCCCKCVGMASITCPRHKE